MSDQKNITPILAYSDQFREALSQKAKVIEALCANLIEYWLDLGRELTETLAMFEAEEQSFSEYRKWVRDETDLGDTTETNLRRTWKYLDENPDKLAAVPKSYLVEVRWNKLQTFLAMEENRELGKKTFLKSARITRSGIFMRFTHLSTTFELKALTTRELERLRDGENPDGKKPDKSKSGKRSGDVRASKLEAENEELRARVAELESEVEWKDRRIDELEPELEWKSRRIDELEDALRKQGDHLTIDVAASSTVIVDENPLPEGPHDATIESSYKSVPLLEEKPATKTESDADTTQQDEFTEYKRARSLAEAEEMAASGAWGEKS
tara:strand:+ start:295 stop:1272 length:978 start_codon:yes stop_codon:yes gene_type:complete